jgi:hypothetical protein
MTLAQAIERKDWNLVSLMLLLGVRDVASKLPPESLAVLLDLMGGEPMPREGGRRGHV